MKGTCLTEGLYSDSVSGLLPTGRGWIVAAVIIIIPMLIVSRLAWPIIRGLGRNPTRLVLRLPGCRLEIEARDREPPPDTS
jgi:hypothetical protein